MMCELLVEGGERLYGELTIQGSKNSVLPILAATLLCADTCVIENCPKLRDVDASVAILRHLGCCTHWEDSALVVDTARMDRAVVPDALMREMRSSVISARFWRAARKRRSVIPAAASWGRVPLTCT